MIVPARFITLGLLLGFLSQVTPVFARASSFEDEIWNAKNIDGLPPEVRRALTRMCVTWRRNVISLVTFKTRNFSFCTLGVFVVAIRLLSVLKEDAYIRFTEKKVTAITC